jgi:hypothetical protein
MKKNKSHNDPLYKPEFKISPLYTEHVYIYNDNSEEENLCGIKDTMNIKEISEKPSDITNNISDKDRNLSIMVIYDGCYIKGVTYFHKE